MQQEKDYLQREIERITLFLKTLLRRFAGLDDENFEEEFHQMETDLQTEFDFSIKAIGELDSEQLKTKLAQLHHSHVEILAEIAFEVFKKSYHNPTAAINTNRLVLNTLEILYYLDSVSKTFSVQRENWKAYLKNHTSN